MMAPVPTRIVSYLARVGLTIALCLGGGMNVVRAAGVPAEDWAAYKAKFLDDDGRIIDNGNGNISHSEGQGYGMILAYLANSPSDFEQIWSFTRTELLLRDDGLAVWKWDPAVKPHVTDTNNASDGDLLIAYGLAMAGVVWKRPDYTVAARRIAQTLLDSAVTDVGGRTILLPGLSGFDREGRSDGPVVNPSYWVYEALPVMNMLVPSARWQKLAIDGKALLAQMQFGPRRLPADWVSLARKPKPAEGFEPEYGYNALRIPLYLVRAGETDRSLLAPFSVKDGDAGIFELSSGNIREPLSDPGYLLINRIVACVVDGSKLPEEVKRFEPVLYYPSTLQLLGMAFIAEKHPECL